MIPYRPCIMRIPGARNRAQAMNDGFGELPSLLDSLVFYPVWIGSQCVDMVSGSVLTNSANPVVPDSTDPADNIAGSFLAASSRRLYGPSLWTGEEVSVAAWAKVTSIAVAHRCIFANLVNPTLEGIYLGVAHTTGLCRFIPKVGAAQVIVYSSVAARLNQWECVIATVDSSGSASINVSGIARSQNLGGKISPSSAAHYCGSYYGGEFFNGSIGSIAVWNRCVSDREQLAYYANGQGINLSKFF